MYIYTDVVAQELRAEDLEANYLAGS